MLLTAAFLMFCSGTLLAVNYTQNYTTAVNKTLRLESTGSGNDFQVYDNGNLNAATYDAFGPITVAGGGTLTIIFDTSKPVNIFGSGNNYCIFVSDGTVDIKLGDNYSASPTLIRSTNCTHKVFYVASSTSDNQASCVLNITGKENKHFIVDGRANLQVRGTNETGYTATNTGTGVVQAAEALLMLTGNGGYVDFEYVDLVNNVNGSGAGGAIAFGLGNTSAHFHLEMTHGKIEKCFANSSGAAWNFSGNYNETTASSITMEDCIIQDCFTESSGGSDGGTFRTWSGPNCDIVMTDCQILNNKSKKRSGGIMYNLAMSQPMELTRCTFDKNWTGENGGALQLQAAATVTACTFTNNYAQINGGAICNRPYDGGSGNSTGYAPHNGSLILDENTIISNNTAGGNGGGLWVYSSPTKFRIGYSDEWTVFYNNNGQQFSMNVQLDGATISNNTATNGGGIYVHRDTDIYQTNVYLNWGKVENNTATGYGGACYVFSEIPTQNYVNKDENGNPCPYTGEARNMVVAIGSSSSAHTLTMQGNVSANGGGVYATYDHNTAVTSSTIKGSFNQNCIVGSQASPNIANSGSGGALYMDKGDLTISGGIITYNTATVNGGGIYTTTNANVKVDAGDFSVQHNMVNGVPNNLYLPTNKKIEVISDAFDPQYIGIYTQSSTTPIPVFEVSNAENYGYLSRIYDGMVNGTMNVVDDKQLYSAEYTSPQTILYFGNSSPWSPLQKTATLGDLHLVNGVYEISNVKELTAFLWHVNGITTHGDFGSGDASAKGKLTADIDMYGHYWVPIGKSTAAYTGTFDGNGYIISNLTMVPSNESEERGLFGVVTTNGIVKNVNLRDSYLASGSGYIGGVVSQMTGGTLYNSVAQSQLLATTNSCTAGGLVGYINGGSVHSSIATCEMTGYTMGGLAGKISSSGNLYNSFANPKFNYTGGSGENAKFVGGLVAENSGTVANCYVRFSRPQSLTDAKFGQLAGSIGTGGSVSNCYTPSTFTSDVPPAIVSSGNATASYTYEIADAPYLYTRSSDNKVTGLGTTLTKALNGWVDRHQNQGYASWNRSTAGGYSYTYDDGRGDVTVTGGNINDDYPLPKMQGLCCAASPDGLAIEYKKSLDDMITKYNGLSGGGTIWLYDSPKEDDGSDELVSETNDGDVLLYIDEDASLLQSYDPENTSSNNTLTAYTGQTLKAYWNDGGDRWHFFSSPLRQSQIGISYSNNDQVAYSWEVDPCGVRFSQDNDNALFPSDMPVNAFDLHSFYEPEYHWINFRRNSNSHWHMNANEVQIHYNGNGTGGNGNETYLVPGKGYLVSINQEQLVQNKGILNNGDVTLQNVTKTNFNAWAERLGFNLLGNPYQSYLDFEKFINDGTVNNGSNLWEGTSEYTNTYATYDPKQKAYVQYTSNPSQGANTASQYIHPHQGFFVRMTKGGENTNTTTVTYTNDMRTNETDTQSGFRSDGSQPAYPLVNFTVRDGEGNADVAVLEIGRPADEGAPKMRLGDCAGVLSLGHEGKDYGILFRTEVEDYQPLRFEATESGTFTLTWNTANADFERLTLIDNIAGTETDMLVRDSYRFEATADQYASRFKVVIGDYKGIDEPETPEPAEGSTFAFRMGDQIVVNGEGTLQIVDMLGRVVKTERLTGSQSMVSLPMATAGIYLLRLTDKNGTKTQKIVIEK